MAKKKYKFLNIGTGQNIWQVPRNTQAYLMLDPAVCNLQKIVVHNHTVLHLFCFYQFEQADNISFNLKIYLKNEAKAIITQCYFGGQSVQADCGLVFEGQYSSADLNG